jgi:hypothetical protein
MQSWPQPFEGSHLYKYRSLASPDARRWVGETILESTLYFSALSELNDPDEGGLLLDGTDAFYEFTFSEFLRSKPGLSLVDQAIHRFKFWQGVEQGPNAGA